MKSTLQEVGGLGKLWGPKGLSAPSWACTRQALPPQLSLGGMVTHGRGSQSPSLPLSSVGSGVPAGFQVSLSPPPSHGVAPGVAQRQWGHLGSPWQKDRACVAEAGLYRMEMG